MITIRLTRDEITPDLRRILKSVQPGGALAKVLGRTGANELRRHFRKLNAKRPNRLGGTRSNFYSRVAESVQAPVSDAAGIRIAISHAHIAQRLFGGPIRARNRKMIAIPIDPRGYGVYPRIYPGTLAYLPSKSGGGVLVEAEERTITRGKNKGGKRKVPKPGGVAIHALKGAITQRAAPPSSPPASA